MLRQILQALRFAIADFFAVPWQGVAAMLVAIVFWARARIFALFTRGIGTDS